MKIIALSISFLFSLSVFAYGGSMSKTCSGRLRYCDQWGICTQEHYYLYAYQNISLNSDGSLRRHSYRLRTRSQLGVPEDYIPRDFVKGRHLVFDGPEFSLAIPWDGTLPIYYFQPHLGVDEWQILCQ